jgi:hypothetical protein
MNKAHEYSPEDWKFAQQVAASLYEQKKTPSDCPELEGGERDLLERAYCYPIDEVLLSFAGKMSKEGRDWKSVEMPEILRLRIADLLKHCN